MGTVIDMATKRDVTEEANDRAFTEALISELSKP